MTLKIIASNVTDKVEQFRLTRGNSEKMQDVPENHEVTTVTWVLYEETKQTVDKDTGETKDSVSTVFVCTDTDGKTYGTVSPTFINHFREFLDVCVESPARAVIHFQVGCGKSKAGRRYIDFVPLSVEE